MEEPEESVGVKEEERAAVAIEGAEGDGVGEGSMQCLPYSPFFYGNPILNYNYYNYFALPSF